MAGAVGPETTGNIVDNFESGVERRSHVLQFLNSLIPACQNGVRLVFVVDFLESTDVSLVAA